MRYTTLFFDLDDTLYSHANGLWAAIRERMGLYMAERMGIPPERVPTLREHYYRTYGTTLRGLQLHFRVNPQEYLDYVHDLPLEQYLQPRPELRPLLMGLPQRRWIFTNADVNHARRVLTILGLSDCFEGIIDIYALDFVCKPQEEAYLRALRLAGATDAKRCVLVDDSLANLEAARPLGFTTVWVTTQAEAHPAADYTLEDLAFLPRVMPILWKDGRA